MSVVGPRAIRHCTVCGAPAGPGSTFCSRCGKVLELPRPVSVAYCRDCGAEVSLGDAYCASCGAPQPPSAAPPAVPPVQAPAEPAEVVVESQAAVGAQIVWYLFVGLWLSLLVTIAAWTLTITVVGQPAARWLARQVPLVLTLQPGPRRRLLTSRQSPVARSGDRRLATGDSGEARPVQLPFVIRAVYFAAAGWWLSLVWLLLAYTLAILVIPMPVAEWMFDELSAITTLERD